MEGPVGEKTGGGERSGWRERKEDEPWVRQNILFYSYLAINLQNFFFLAKRSVYQVPLLVASPSWWVCSPINFLPHADKDTYQVPD